MAALTLAGTVISGGIIPARVGQAPSSRPVRVLLAAPRDDAPVRATVSWRLVDGTRHVIARSDTGADWIVQREGRRVRAVGPSGVGSPWYQGPATLEPSDTGGLLLWNARHFRGVLVYVPIDTALLVIDRLDVEDYLRGVVPLEAGTGLPAEHAAVEAQAVAARSFTYSRMLAAGPRPYDLTASSTDQVFGGVGVETFIGDLAVDATAGWVLSYGGQVVNAPYHSTCGGSTAAPDEVWKVASVPYLQPVSDRIPGTDRFYCDIAPRFHWERALRADELTGAVERYARAYAPVPSGAVGAVRAVVVEGTTPSGRVSAVSIVTDRAQLRIAGNDIRYVLRAVGGEILPSTYFSLHPETAANGRLARLVIRGQGNGHGVGMCQWGAIGRARAGQDFRAILRAYYPGAQLMRAP
jgi:stage II sporulation protein D (peptidoglycan lytic transglycosylase)